MTTPRRILITNNTLANRAGSELYVRDIATGLRDLGHAPVAYSTVLGEVAEELRLLTVPVLDDLSKLHLPPDIIHGQHHMETMTALAQFPAVPAIYVCHGWLPWEETPPIHPRILRYVAVDDTVRDRLLIEHGIPEEKVEVILNFVDTNRFQPRSPLPSRPHRAIAFSNEISEGGSLDVIRSACSQRGIELDVRGTGIGASLAEPEQILPLYDLVFARGRSAIEALAVGAAVIPVAPDTFGPMVSTENLSRYRSMNFGIRSIQQRITLDALLREIDSYDSSDAEAVSREIRTIADMRKAVEALLQIYERAIEEFRSTGESPAESAAFARYLQWLSESMKGKVLGLNHVPALRSRAQKQDRELAHLREALRASQTQIQEFESQTVSRLLEAETLQNDWEEAIAKLMSEIEVLRRERDDLRTKNAQLGNEVARLEAEVATLGPAVSALESEFATRSSEQRERESALQRSIEELSDRIARAEAEKRDWERSVSSRIVGIIRRTLWR